MQDISNMNREGLPSTKNLLKATGFAALIGLLVLITTILPAEYGIDPTGLGKTMGLTVLSQANAAEVTPEAIASSSDNLIPLFMVFNPVIILGGPLPLVLWNGFIAILALAAFATAIEYYLFGPMPAWMRVLLTVNFLQRPRHPQTTAAAETP